MNTITIKGLNKSFGSFKAVSDLDLEIEKNTVFGFLGPNGAGKTTTIRMMVGLIKSDSGSIEIGGAPVMFGDSQSHSHFGYLAEQPSFYNWMSGPEYMSFTADLFGIRGPEKSKRINGLLDRVDLSSTKNKRIGTYSNGMKQRLGIAQALINDPQVLILDEPVSALDPIGRKEVLNIIQELGKDKTVFMSTHILADVDKVCNSVAIINEGRLITQSPLATLKEKYAAPILEIEFSTDPAAIAAEISGADWIKKIETSGNRMRIWLNDIEVMSVNLPLKVLSEFKAGILSYGLTLPEAEDLFVELLEQDNA